MAKLKVALLDRDGTIIVEKNHVYKIEDFEPIPGAIEALQLLTRQGVKIYIITNQAGIAKGYYTESDFIVFTEYMLDQFQGQDINIERVLHCPHHPDGVVPQFAVDCDCRKPATGLVSEALALGHIHPQEAMLVGDKNSDIEAGRAMGVTTYLVLTGYGEKQRPVTKADFIAADLLEAVRYALYRESYE